jgi:hypothetical protein
VTIFIHMLFASPPLCQGPSLWTLSLNVMLELHQGLSLHEVAMDLLEEDVVIP